MHNNINNSNNKNDNNINLEKDKNDFKTTFKLPITFINKDKLHKLYLYLK